MARYAVDKLRLRTGVVIAKQETYAKGVQQVFAEEFQAKGGSILESIEFPAGTAEFGAFAERVAVLKPDFSTLSRARLVGFAPASTAFGFRASLHGKSQAPN